MALTWAGRRKLSVFLILGGTALVVGGAVVAKVLYHPPSCTDGVKNQGETSVDHGGPCPYLSNADLIAPTVLYALPLINKSGRVDIVASVENKNADAAAKKVPYTLSLYDTHQSVITEVHGTIDLPPRAVVPIFTPGVLSGKVVAQAFLEIDAAAPQWFRVAGDPRIVPVASNISLHNASTTPEIDATLTNATVTPLSNVRVVALVHAASGNVIAAASTVVPIVPAQSTATATFLWNEPFLQPSGLIEVQPVVPLP